MFALLLELGNYAIKTSKPQLRKHIIFKNNENSLIKQNGSESIWAAERKANDKTKCKRLDTVRLHAAIRQA